MTLGRRSFLVRGGAIAGGGFLHAASAKASARSVAELGLKPDTDGDLSEALQKAVMEISAAGEAIYLPGGTYRASSIQLPDNVAITGVPGQTWLVTRGNAPVFIANDTASLRFSGFSIEGSALTGRAIDVMIDTIRINNAPGAAIALTGIQSLNISRCQIKNCAGAAIDITSGDSVTNTAALKNNHIVNCKTGIALKGNGHVTGNAVSGASGFGLRLGGAQNGGTILADGNIVNDCKTGIGVAANEEILLVSLNLINGLTGPTSAAIRAFTGDELVGPDLAFESSEAYLNLTIVGNVAR